MLQRAVELSQGVGEAQVLGESTGQAMMDTPSWSSAVHKSAVAPRRWMRDIPWRRSFPRT